MIQNTNYKNRQIIVCSKDCPCHKGARYDQIECVCEWFCGYGSSPELLKDIKNEKYTIEESTG